MHASSSSPLLFFVCGMQQSVSNKMRQTRQGFSIEELRAGDDGESQEESEEEDDEKEDDEDDDEEEEENGQDFDNLNEKWVENKFGSGETSLVCPGCFAPLSFKAEPCEGGIWKTSHVLNCSLDEEHHISCSQCQTIVGFCEGFVGSNNTTVHFTDVLPSSRVGDL